MKIFIQSAVILAVLLGSGLSQAATTTASIPMGVDVPKSCTFSNVIYAELSGDFPLGNSRQPTYKSLRPFDLVS